MYTYVFNCPNSYRFTDLLGENFAKLHQGGQSGATYLWGRNDFCWDFHTHPWKNVSPIGVNPSSNILILVG